MVTLETPRLLLRPWQAEDLDDYLRVFSKAPAMAFQMDRGRHTDTSEQGPRQSLSIDDHRSAGPDLTFQVGGGGGTKSWTSTSAGPSYRGMASGLSAGGRGSPASNTNGI